MRDVDIIAEATRLLGPLVLILSGLYAWKKQKRVRLGRNIGLAIWMALIAADLGGLRFVVRTAFPDHVFDAAVWLLLAVAVWFAINAEFEKNWVDGGA